MTATDAADPVDAALVRRAQAGDREAFGQLVDRHRHSAVRAAVAALGSAADAEDVAQDAFVTAFQKLKGFRGESSFKTWLLTITWRKALDRRASARRWLRRLAEPVAGPGGDEREAVDLLSAAGQSHEDALVGADLERRLRKLIAGLPRKLRDALLLAGGGEYTYEEIGQILKIPVGTVKWRVSEARKVLKKKMTAMGYENV